MVGVVVVVSSNNGRGGRGSKYIAEMVCRRVMVGGMVRMVEKWYIIMVWEIIWS